MTVLLPRRFAVKRGLAYPLTVEDGGLKLSEDLDLIFESIISVIETRLFERVMRPSLGTPEYIFTTVFDPSLIAEQVRQALETQVTGVSSWDISGEMSENGVFLLTIDYQVDGIPQPPIQYQLSN